MIPTFPSHVPLSIMPFQSTSSIYYPKRKQRDSDARIAYQQEASLDDLNGLFMRDIIREGVTNDDPRLR